MFEIQELNVRLLSLTPIRRQVSRDLFRRFDMNMIIIKLKKDRAQRNSLRYQRGLNREGYEERTIMKCRREKGFMILRPSLLFPICIDWNHFRNIWMHLDSCRHEYTEWCRFDKCLTFFNGSIELYKFIYSTYATRLFSSQQRPWCLLIWDAPSTHNCVRNQWNKLLFLVLAGEISHSHIVKLLYAITMRPHLTHFRFCRRS